MSSKAVLFHSENVAQPVPALVSCAHHNIYGGLPGFIHNGSSGFLDSIFDALEFSLRRTAWVSFQLSQPYRRVDVTEEFHRAGCNLGLG